MKEIAKFMLMPLLVLTMLTTTFASSPGIVVNNKRLSVNTFNQESRVLVPIRAIFESLNATVNYDSSTKTITGNQDGKVIILKVDDKVASVNSDKVKLDVPAQIIKDNIVVPVRFIGEALGTNVVWADKTVFIDFDGNVPGDHKAALKAAETYAYKLHMSKVFVYENLISEHGGEFSKAAAKYAVDNIDVNWKQNALRTAEIYAYHLNMSASEI